MLHNKLVRPVGLALVAALVISLGASGSAFGATNSSRSLMQMRIAYTPTADPILLTMIANGSLLANGLDVQATMFATGVPETAAIASGSVDLAFMASAPFISMADQGYGVHAFAETFNDIGNQNIVVNPNSGIRFLADLKGKKVGLAVGTIQEFILAQALAKVGLTENDIQIVNVNTTTGPPAYQNGGIDAAVCLDGEYQQLLKDGAKTLEPATKVLGTSGISGLVFAIARDSYAQKNPQAIARFLKAMAQTEASVKKNPATAIGLFSSFFGMTKKNATSLYDNGQIVPLQAQANPKSAYNLLNQSGVAKSVTPVINFMQSQNQLQKPITSSSLFDSSYLIAYLKTVANTAKK